jgi:hypothetical protein
LLLRGLLGGAAGKAKDSRTADSDKNSKKKKTGSSEYHRILS